MICVICVSWARQHERWVCDCSALGDPELCQVSYLGAVHQRWSSASWVDAQVVWCQVLTSKQVDEDGTAGASEWECQAGIGIIRKWHTHQLDVCEQDARGPLILMASWPASWHTQ